MCLGDRNGVIYEYEFSFSRTTLKGSPVIIIDMYYVYIYVWIISLLGIHFKENLMLYTVFIKYYVRIPLFFWGWFFNCVQQKSEMGENFNHVHSSIVPYVIEIVNLNYDEVKVHYFQLFQW